MKPDMETHSDNETNERKEMPTWRSLSFVCFENEIDSSEAPSQKSISSAKNIGKIEIIRNRYEAIPITWFKTNPCLSASLPLSCCFQLKDRIRSSIQYWKNKTEKERRSDSDSFDRMIQEWSLIQQLQFHLAPTANGKVSISNFQKAFKWRRRCLRPQWRHF